MKEVRWMIFTKWGSDRSVNDGNSLINSISLLWRLVDVIGSLLVEDDVNDDGVEDGSGR